MDGILMKVLGIFFTLWMLFVFAVLCLMVWGSWLLLRSMWDRIL